MTLKPQEKKKILCYLFGHKYNDFSFQVLKLSSRQELEKYEFTCGRCYKENCPIQY